MADISAIGEMLSGLRQAIEIVKFLEEHATSAKQEDGSKFAELVQILGSMRGQLFELQTIVEFSELEKNIQETSTLVKLNDAYYEVDEHNNSPFAQSTSHILNFKLAVEMSTQPQPLQDSFLHP